MISLKEDDDLRAQGNGKRFMSKRAQARALQEDIHKEAADLMKRQALQAYIGINELRAKAVGHDHVRSMFTVVGRPNHGRV